MACPVFKPVRQVERWRGSVSSPVRSAPPRRSPLIKRNPGPMVEILVKRAKMASPHRTVHSRLTGQLTGVGAWASTLHGTLSQTRKGRRI